MMLGQPGEYSDNTSVKAGTSRYKPRRCIREDRRDGYYWYWFRNPVDGVDNIRFPHRLSAALFENLSRGDKSCVTRSRYANEDDAIEDLKEAIRRLEVVL